MDDEMSHVQGGGIPSPSGWSTGFSQTNDSFNDIREQPLFVPAPNFVPEPCILGQGRGETDSNQFGPDISQMLDNPFRNLRHRRAHSEILTRPDNGINFDGDLGVLRGSYKPFFSDENVEPDLSGIYLDMDRLNSSSAMPPLFQVGETSSAATVLLPPPLPPHSAVAVPLATATGPTLGLASSYAETSVGERTQMRHHYSQSMDGSMTINPEVLAPSSQGPSGMERKKALSAAKLAELALVDPRRAKRILSNRQSAARSKERKLRYIWELERKVQTLETHATALNSQLTFLQRKTTCLNTENHELKYRLQTMEQQQVQLQDALNDALKDEIEHLKVLTGHPMPNCAPAMMPSAPFTPCPPFYPPNNSDASPLNVAQQLQQLQIQRPDLQHPLQVQHHLVPQLEQPTGNFSICGPVHLAIEGDNHAADNSSGK
ncbi:probable transcription factor PosF21 [Rhodamnia argentea]|uniref:Probable transcription factor PosF21 n=1 Tax=Rhodamnia argentea TaxID=178133 RepID=A0A8B8PP81_9MYRT|nr:probable transcription factor PosF21 [Rhodamnia argentea]